MWSASPGLTVLPQVPCTSVPWCRRTFPHLHLPSVKMTPEKIVMDGIRKCMTTFYPLRTMHLIFANGCEYICISSRERSLVKGVRACVLRSCVSSHMADADTRVADKASVTDWLRRMPRWSACFDRLWQRRKPWCQGSVWAGGRRRVVDKQQQPVADVLDLIPHFNSLPS